MELKEGMYVRTRQGIAKMVERPRICVVVYNDRKVIYVDENGYPISTSFSLFVFEDEISKASFNIIDLIEVGDYVNGVKVTNCEPVDKIDTERYIGFGNYDYYIHESKDIKSVVTKEQFNSIKYEVK